MAGVPPRICIVDDDRVERKKIHALLLEIPPLSDHGGPTASGGERVDIKEYDNVDDLLPLIAAAKAGQPFDFDVIFADVFMPYDPGGQFAHPHAGAIRIYEAIKDAGLQDRVTLVIISKNIDHAEKELALIRAEQGALDHPWAEITPKPSSPWGKSRAAFISRENWMGAVEKAITRRRDRPRVPPIDLLSQVFFAQVRLALDTLTLKGNAPPFLLITGEDGSAKEAVARYFAAQLNRSVELKPFMLRPGTAAGLAERLFGRELPPPPVEGHLELHPKDIIFIDGFCSKSDQRGKLDETLLGLFRSMDQPGQDGSSQFYRIEGFEPKRFEGTVVLSCTRLEDLQKNTEVDDKLLKLITSRRVHIPALRERPDRIGALARYFLAEVAPSKKFDGAALRRLAEHQWPGNLRELQDKIALLATEVSEDWIGIHDLHRLQIVNSSGPSRGPGLRTRMHDFLNGQKRNARRLFARRGKTWEVVSVIFAIIACIGAAMARLDPIENVLCRWHVWPSQGCAPPSTPSASGATSAAVGRQGQAMPK